jgi:hypothetical protein
MRKVEVDRKKKRSRKGYDHMPAGLSIYLQQKWMKGEAAKAADGVEVRKYGVKYEEFSGRMTYRFCCTDERRDEVIAELEIKGLKYWKL